MIDKAVVYAARGTSHAGLAARAFPG
jgi:hypothetical protein